MKLIIKIIKNVIRVLENITSTSISVKKKPRIRIKVHKDATNDGTSMALYVKLVKKFCTHKPKNIFEIGANYAQDAEFLRKSFKLSERDIYVFEPHPQIFEGNKENV